jgi:lipopolysaccharide assembly outer membrane protein LptD (OstA)
MKLILFVVSVLGVAALGSAQVATDPTVVSNKQYRDATGVHMRGAVEIRVGTVRITADEADTHGDTGEFELRGNVRLLTR